MVYHSSQCSACTAAMCRAGVCFNLSWIRNDYHNIWTSSFLLEHQNRWSGCQPRVHERPRGHSKRGNVSNLNILIQPTAVDTRRSINVGLKLGQRRKRWTNVKPTMIQRLESVGGPFHIKHKTLTKVELMPEQRRWWWTDITPELAQYLGFAKLSVEHQ